LITYSYEKQKKSSPVFADVVKTGAEQFGDMAVVKAVKDILSLLPRTHNTGITQYPELMGDGRLVHAEDSGQVADTEFGTMEGVQDPDAGMVPEHLEKTCHPFLVTLPRH
jgi:hypothetical protein